MRALLLLVLLASCAPPTPPSTELYAHPWPDERMRTDSGVDPSSFPHGTGSPMRRAALAQLEGADGFGLASPIVFPLAAPIDAARLPTVERSRDADATVFVIDVDASSPSFGERALVDVRVLADGGPHGGTNVLVVLPYPGVPLRPGTLYVAGVSAALVDGVIDTPTPAHAEARDALARLRVETPGAWAVFRTGDPTRELYDAVAQAIDEDPIELEPPTLTEVYDDYCVFRSDTRMPTYQQGSPPFLHDGGAWARRADGRLARQDYRDSRVWITVPRRASEASPFPSAVFVRAGGGGDRPLVDRGRRDREGVSEPGTGIARELAQAGYVGFSVDGPLGGARNLAGWDEQTTIFNLLNPVALRDNVRQSALELVLFARTLDGFAFDASACPGAAPRVEPSSRPVLIAHSTGATIAPLAMAAEPRFSALVMSGAGASWIRQIVHKQSPMPIRPFVEALVGYAPFRRMIEHDPLLGLVQWAGEPADPMVYGPALRDRPVLVFQGVLDTYIPPPIANPVTLALGLALAGEPLDEALDDFRPATDDLALVGGRTIELPADFAESPRLLTQLPSDGIEDGHEVLFQRPDARRQLRCFLETLREGRARLVAPRAEGTCLSGPDA